jgi:predicted nucleotide-binding protein
MALPVADQEFVVHLYAPLDGPLAEEAYRQVRRLWTACHEALGMTHPVTGLRVPALPPGTLAELPPGGVIAVQETPDGNRQSVLRREHDVLNLSVALAQPRPEGLRARPDTRLTPVQSARRPPKRRMGWADFAQIWDQAGGPDTGAMLGEARLFLARMPAGGVEAAAATAEFGRSLDPLLPYRDDRLDWWRRGTTTAAGYAVWDTLLASDTSRVRELVLIGAADSDEELSAWAWSDGTPAMPPLARYLMHAAKLRYEARLLDAWHSHLPASNDLGRVFAELDAALSLDAARPGLVDLLRSRLRRLRAEEARLTAQEAELAHLSRTVVISQSNLDAAAAQRAGPAGAGMFAADHALAQWLVSQIDDDLGYVKIDLARTSRVRELAAEELTQAERTDPEPPASLAASATASGPGQPAASRGPAGGTQAARTDVAARVFVVHGRDAALRAGFFGLLRTVRLEPLEWEKLVTATGSTAPYLGQVVAQAPHMAQATLVLLSPDDIVELHTDLVQDNDLPHERTRSGQARPNVLFELGLALMAYPAQTVVIEVGEMRPVADLAGLNVIRFDGSPTAIKKVLDRLHQAGCPVDYSGDDWLDPGRFASLAAYKRGPGKH